MVTWVPYCPPSCSTRGKPFPLGAFSKGLGAGEWVGAVRCWAQQGDTFLVGSIQNTSQGPVCTVNNRGRVERSPEFWILVAGAELDWVPCTGTNTLPNTVPVPGTDTGDCIGMFGDIIGTVSKCQCMYGVSRTDSSPFQRSQQLRILVQTGPSSLKSSARKVVRRAWARKRSQPDRRIVTMLERGGMPDLVKYLDFRE